MLLNLTAAMMHEACLLVKTLVTTKSFRCTPLTQVMSSRAMYMDGSQTQSTVTYTFTASVSSTKTALISTAEGYVDAVYISHQIKKNRAQCQEHHPDQAI